MVACLGTHTLLNTCRTICSTTTCSTVARYARTSYPKPIGERCTLASGFSAPQPRSGPLPPRWQFPCVLSWYNHPPRPQEQAIEAEIANATEGLRYAAQLEREREAAVKLLQTRGGLVRVGEHCGNATETGHECEMCARGCPCVTRQLESHELLTMELGQALNFTERCNK